MEEVYPVALALGIAGAGVSLNAGASRGTGGLPGRVERALEAGRFLVLLPDGDRIEVSGKEGLKPGDAVRVVLKARPGAVTGGGKGAGAGSGETSRGESLMSAFIPLAFGGKEAQARLEVFLPGRGKQAARSKGQVVTFVFDVTTRSLGRIQWGVHLRGREVALQVYSEAARKDPLRALVSGAERALQQRGFVLSATTVFLKRPFTVPSGSMNVRG
jgi:hypothetical protein